MELYSFKIKGFRRYEKESSLRTQGKLVAIVGPNEAGKSSLLSALQHLGSDEPVARNDLTRNASQEDFKLEWKFFLNSEELKEANIEKPTWLIVSKNFHGEVEWRFEPTLPEKDISSRAKLISSIDKLWATKALDSFLENYSGDKVEWLKSKDIIEKSEGELDKEFLEDVSESLDKFLSLIESNTKSSTRIARQSLEDFLKYEYDISPEQKAIYALEDYIPEIIEFDYNSRNLKHEYTYSEVLDSKNVALRNLFSIAGIDVGNLIEAVENNDKAKIKTIEINANRVLKKEFKAQWKQSDVAVSIDIGESNINIQVENESSEFTSFAERSDGLRQFVALLAFVVVGNDDRDKIILIDEAEQRLHYDAQADLVQMLARQEFSSKVIYTTHSAGCLPEDLGNGVRLVEVCHENESRSVIKNKFWSSKSTGISPLLYGMGASTLAFFPTRNAVIVEGPVDMILYPTLFKAINNNNVLGYQFVPALSVANDYAQMSNFGSAGGVVYLVDNDNGGKKLKSDIIKSGVDEKKVFSLNSNVVECEDFFSGDVLIESINSLLVKHYPKVSIFKRSEFTKAFKFSSLEDAFFKKTGAKVSKVELAYEILDLISSDPTREFIHPSRSKHLSELARQIESAFVKMHGE